MPYTPVVFCAVSAVIALIAYILCIVMVLISACIPAPPLQSEPAIVRIFFIVYPFCFSELFATSSAFAFNSITADGISCAANIADTTATPSRPRF